MIEVGTIKEIWRYPVKGMAGEQLDSCAVSAQPNFVIETAAALSGLAEQAWVGKRLKLGAVEIDCVLSTPRCGAVTRAQPTLGIDKSILRTIVKEADQNLGIYGMTSTAGELRVGDTVQLL